MSMSDLFKFLFEDSQQDAELESFAQELAEELESAEKLKSKKTPLQKALSKVGVELSSFELDVCPDIDGYVLTTKDGDAYKNAHQLLNSPDGMHAMAELDWFYSFGDRASTDGELSIFFSEISGDEDPSDTEKLADIEKLAKDSYDFVNQGIEPREDEKATNNKDKGVDKATDGAAPKGKPKGAGKKVSEGRHGTLRSRAHKVQACPGCGCMPGDGVTATCNHPDGCGYYKQLEGDVDQLDDEPEGAADPESPNFDKKRFG